jgi:hypothetical protein
MAREPEDWLPGSNQQADMAIYVGRGHWNQLNRQAKTGQILGKAHSSLFANAL